MNSELLTKSAVCANASVLSKSMALKIILSVKCVLCTLGIAATIYVLWKAGLSWLGSRTTRFIFIGHVVSALLCSAGFAFCYGYDVYRLSKVNSDPCDYTLDVRFAFFVRIIPVFGMFGSIYFMGSLAIESRISESKFFSNMLVLTVVFLSLFVPIVFLVPPLNWNQRMYIFNTRTNENSEMFQYMIWLEIGPELLAILFFHVALYINRHRSPQTDMDYLNSRVQIESSKRVIRIVLPILWTYLAFLATTTFGITFYPVIFSDYTVTSWYIAMECFNVIQMFPLALAAILYYQLLFRPKELPRMQLATIREQNINADPNEHFYQLQACFANRPAYGRIQWFEGCCCCN